ncbi:ATP-binding protein [Segetibacter sp. 3557_3]|uniref:ATP-binding protein n=1 Tax=Segetibacter sp. 3557_3 TaxID=2547429 RepID=UPI0010591C4D|nr:ATP-binding protein [Segetibacter sp. 3557_3]TDH23447.1 ATP-binding protein [Segetibacter sp. 3557_3]
MKYILSTILVALSIGATGQKHSLEKIWETDSIIAVPESVLPEGNILYTSLIDGAPWGADGKGGVAKLTLAGKVIDTTWVTGLHAPKGMGRVGNSLYVADITEVVVVNVTNGKIEKRIKVESAVALNDVTVTDRGIVYVSDSRTGRIWRLENDVPQLFLENMTNVNGLKWVKNELYIASGKSFVRADSNKKITAIAELPEGGDGVEPVGNGDFIVTSWMGYVYYVTADGKVETLLDLTKEKKNTADIGYDPAKRIVYLPTFNGKTVAAYRLK